MLIKANLKMADMKSNVQAKSDQLQKLVAFVFPVIQAEKIWLLANVGKSGWGMNYHPLDQKEW